MVVSEAPITAEYKGLQFDVVYRADMLVEDKVVVEMKVAEKLLAVHEAQLLSYLRLMDKKLGLLINFNVPVLKDGIKRVVNHL
jgi:GxxExxY protein